MKKNNNLVYYLFIDKDLALINKDKYINGLDIKKYNFKIKYIEKNSELLDSFKIPFNTQCFFIFNTLFIIEDNIQFPVAKIADSVYFLLDLKFNKIEIELLYNYIKTTNYFKNISINIKLKNNITKEFTVRSYLFEEKIKYTSNYSNFELMMLKSRNIISKIKEKDIVRRDIDYLLNKGY